MEHFQDNCKDPISWIQQSTFYLEFSEGWALYAENPLISRYTDTYKDDPLTKYGMLKWQVRRLDIDLAFFDVFVAGLGLGQ